jgi:hypothetical protein
VASDPGEGDHLAVLYTDPDDRDALLLPYLAGARARGEGAVCVTAVEPDLMASQVRALGGEVEVLPTAEAYLRGGSFSAPFMAGWLAELAAASPAGSQAPRLRIAGDLDWIEVLDADGLVELFRYEATLSTFAPSSRHSLVCFYDLSRLSAAGVVEVLRTHPKAILGGALWDSPFYDPAALNPVEIPPHAPGDG